MMRNLLLMLTLSLIILCGCATADKPDDSPRDLAIEQQWSGDYPVSQLDKLPSDQQQNRVGYIDNATDFAALWQALMPEQPLPQIDFASRLVLFSRNVEYYNQTNIFKITLTDGVVEIMSMETMSAMPVERNAAMALAVVARTGINAIKKSQDSMIPVD
ncbi:MAG: hypothetical protein OET90_00975 [Desulfuromonadales bacterium]|nr:hypothetical protein [Desulfuromonadales bacterium]